MNIEEVKKLVANDDLRIKLHDIIVEELKHLTSKLKSEDFSTKTDWSEDEFERRVKKIEELTSDLCSIQVLLSYWGTQIQKQNYLIASKRIINANHKLKGKTLWIMVRWYPVLLLLYYGGVSTTAAEDFKKMLELMSIRVFNPTPPHSKVSLIQAVTNVFSRRGRHPFEIVLGNKNGRVPQSEYLFKILKSKLEELLFLNSEYESIFNRFEVLLALEYAHQTAGDSPERISAPIGRFGYKRRTYDNPLAEVIEEAKTKGENWPPLKAGLIGGRFDRFEKISSLLDEKVNNIRWSF